MAKTVRTKFPKVDKAFKQTEAYQELVDMGLAAAEHLFDGGFKKKMDSRQRSWKPLDEDYLKSKTRKDGSPLKWVNKGKLLKAVHKNKLTKTGTKAGMKYQLKATTRVTKAIFIPTTYGHHQKSKPKLKMKKRIHSLLDYKRPLFRWDRPDIKEIEENVSKVLKGNFRRAGLGK